MTERTSTKYLECVYDCLSEEVEFPQGTDLAAQHLFISGIDRKEFDPSTNKIRFRFAVSPTPNPGGFVNVQLPAVAKEFQEEIR